MGLGKKIQTKMNTTTAITIPEGVCAFHRGSLTFLRTPTREEWFQIGTYVVAARSAGLRWQSDWRRIGRREFGDEAVAQAEEQLEFKDLKAVEAIDTLDGRGSSAPSDEHAFVVARLCKTPEEAEAWLDRSRTEELSARELQRSIRAGKIVREDDDAPLRASSEPTGILSLDAIHTDFIQWRARAEADGFPDAWTGQQLLKVKDLLSPMREYALKASIAHMQKGPVE